MQHDFSLYETSDAYSNQANRFEAIEAQADKLDAKRKKQVFQAKRKRYEVRKLTGGLVKATDNQFEAIRLYKQTPKTALITNTDRFLNNQ